MAMANQPIDRAVKLGFLKDEYLLIQKQYEDFDTRIMTIKGWSATIGLAALGAGFQYTKYLWIFAAGIGVIFWILEAIWKSFQYNYADRIELLEEKFRTGNVDDVAPFQIYTAWMEVFQRQGYLMPVMGNMTLPLIFFPHIVPVIVGPAIFLCNLHFQFQPK